MCSTVQSSTQVTQEFTLLENMQPGGACQLVQKALKIANEALDKSLGVQASWVLQLSKPQSEDILSIQAIYNQVIGFTKNAELEQVGIIDLRMIDQLKIKTPQQLGQEIVDQVCQHLMAQKTDGIMIFPNGYKIDKRLLKHHEIGVDHAGFLLVNGRRLVTPVKDKYGVLRPSVFWSNDITRWINEGDDGIRIFDKFDLSREDRKGMLIHTSQIKQLESDQLLEQCQNDAIGYTNGYLQLERDTLSDAQIEGLTKVLASFPPLSDPPN